MWAEASHSIAEIKKRSELYIYQERNVNLFISKELFCGNIVYLWDLKCHELFLFLNENLSNLKLRGIKIRN